MNHVPPDVVARLLKELCSTDAKRPHNKSSDISEAIAWTLLRLLENEEEDKIEQGIRSVLNFFQVSSPICQANLCHQFYLTGNFLLIALLCNTAAKMNVPFPSHLLVESSLNITYASAISQHLMGVGSNVTYNLAIVSDGEIEEPRIIPLKRRVRKISMSNTHTLFLTEDGNVFGCGKAAKGQLGPKIRSLVIEADMIFEATDKETIIDICACDGFSIWISHKTVCIAGKFGQIGHESGELQKLKLGTNLRTITFVKEEDTIWIEGVDNQAFKCAVKDSEFIQQWTHLVQKEPTVRSVKVFPWESDLESLRKGYPYTVTFFHNFKRITVDKSADVPIGILRAAINNRQQNVLYSVNGLLLDLNIVDYRVSERGEIFLIASTFCLDGSNNRPRSTCLYKGNIHLVQEVNDQEYRTVGDIKPYRVVLSLQEFPNSHSASHFEISPDGKNLIFVIDKDLDSVYQGEKLCHSLDINVEKELQNPRSVPYLKKRILDTEALNITRLENGMLPVLGDVHLPESLNEKSSKSSNEELNARLDWLEAIYPDAGQYFLGKRFCCDKFREKSPREFLILALLRGHDTIPQSMLPVLYAQMIKQGYKKQRFRDIFTLLYMNIDGKSVRRLCFDHTESKQFFNGFLNEYLAEVGLRAIEIRPTKYLLRPLGEPNFAENLDWDVTILSVDGEAFLFQWDLLLLHSEYFEMIYSYHEANGIEDIEARRACKPLTMSFPSKIVASALRTLLEPNHLYDVEYEDLFSLLGLYDNYLCFTALEETVKILFERANEVNCSLIFEFFNSFEQHQDLLLEHFLNYPQMLLYWKSPYRIPLKLLRMVNNMVRQGTSRNIQIKQRKDQNADSSLLLGTLFVQWKSKETKAPMQQTDGRFFPYNWARFSPEYVSTLYQSSKIQTPSKELIANMTHAKEFNTKEYEENGEQDDGFGLWKAYKGRSKKVPSCCIFYLEDKRWMGKKDPEEKPKRERQASIRKSESLPSVPVEKPCSPQTPEIQEIVFPLATLELKEEIEAVSTFRSFSPEFAAGTDVRVFMHLLSGKEPFQEQITSRSPGQNSDEQNIDPDFPSVSSTTPEPKTHKEKFFTRSKYKAVDVFTPKKPSPAPWAGSSSTSSSKSFKEIQEEEASANRMAPKPMTSKSQPIPVARRSRKNTWNEPSSSTPPAMSFAEIMAEEERRQKPITKPAKSLEAVATEERAMQELAQLYENQFNGEAVISVSLACS